ncbi:MAG: histidinol-phosphatase [Ruminococcus sp.]|nr:histidinol-phosphatase [Ruminococcus sp.]
MVANYHTHTKRCQHAYGEDKEYVENAIKGGLKVLGFSDHCPWIYDSNYISGTRMLPSQLDEYFTSMERLKKEYQRDIKIYVGFESEYIPQQMESQDRLFKGYPIDYMILGEHFISPEPSTYMGFPSKDENYLKVYIDTIIEGMETGRYSYVAHPDLCDFVGDIEVYNKHYEKLCRYLKDKNVPIEINLLGYIEHRHYPNENFLKIAQKVGNIAIVGCDAHTPDRLSNVKAQNECKRLAERFGLKVIDTLPNLD